MPQNRSQNRPQNRPLEYSEELSPWPSSIETDDNPEDIRETIKKVNKKNKEFHDRFTYVSSMISNYRKDKGEFSSINDRLELFLDKVLEKKSGENSINLTMTILDLIYVNLSNGKDMYYFPDNSDFLTKYDKLKDIEKRYSDLVESYGGIK